MQLSNIWPSWKGAHFCDSHGSWEAVCQALFFARHLLSENCCEHVHFMGRFALTWGDDITLTQEHIWICFTNPGLRKNKSTLELIHCNLEISVMFRHFLVNKTLPGNLVPRIQLFLGNLFDGKASRQRRQLRTGAPADRKKNLGWKTRPQCGCYNTCTHPPALEATFRSCKPSGDIAEKEK